MRGLRTPTTLFLVMLLLPAVILAWLGWQASAPLVDELRRAAREEAGQVVTAAAAALPARLDAAMATHVRLAGELAASAAAQLPFERPGRLLAMLEARALGSAVRIVAADGRQILPAGPAASALAYLPEWASFQRWRERLDRGGPSVAAAALASARAFVAPALRVQALAEVAAGDGEAAARELAATPWSALRLAGPRTAEVLRASPAGRTALATGWREGWLAGVPGTEAARSTWWQAAGAPPEELARQSLRERAEGGAPLLRVAAAIGATAFLELLVDPSEVLLSVCRGVPAGNCDIALTPGDTPSALYWPGAGVAATTIATAWGAVAITATHRSLRSIEASALRQRWITGLGIALLLGSIGLGTALVRRALLQERRARKLRDEFIANVSHELKTPLTSVRMYTSMLADPSLEPASRARHGAIAEAEAARLSALVDDLLDFAALERGKRRLEPEPVDLAAAARSLAAVWQVRAADTGTHIDCRADVETLALADPTALLRILTNLLQNACRHGRPARNGTPPRITVAVGPGPVIEVRDNGPGVPVVDRERIFGRFERARRGGEGTGLGLALSRELAQACRGSLVCTDSGTETVFRLTLPAVPPSEHTA